MTTAEIANQLVSLCSAGQFQEAIKTLYSQDIVSVESAGPPEMLEMKGLDAVMGKSQWWVENHEVHAAKVEGPLVAGPYFTVRFWMDITSKPAGGQRMEIEEIGLYKVADGKIVHEHFFYGGM
jgi:hypothetical protein